MADKIRNIVLIVLGAVCAIVVVSVVGVTANGNHYANIAEPPTTTIPVRCVTVTENVAVQVPPGHTFDYDRGMMLVDGHVVAQGVPSEDSAFAACGPEQVIELLTFTTELEPPTEAVTLPAGCYVEPSEVEGGWEPIFYPTPTVHVVPFSTYSENC